jgi:hypothetical protein
MQLAPYLTRLAFARFPRLNGCDVITVNDRAFSKCTSNRAPSASSIIHLTAQADHEVKQISHA